MKTLKEILAAAIKTSFDETQYVFRREGAYVAVPKAEIAPAHKEWEYICSVTNGTEYYSYRVEETKVKAKLLNLLEKARIRVTLDEGDIILVSFSRDGEDLDASLVFVHDRNGVNDFESGVRLTGKPAVDLFALLKWEGVKANNGVLDAVAAKNAANRAKVKGNFVATPSEALKASESAFFEFYKSNDEDFFVVCPAEGEEENPEFGGRSSVYYHRPTNTSFYVYQDVNNAEVFELPEAVSKAVALGGEPCFDQKPLGDDHRHSLWYGGGVLEVRFPKSGIVVCIDAIGDVIGNYLNEAGGGSVAYFRDKRNAGYFYEAISPYLKNDDGIFEATESGRLVLENNNWWEISCVDSQGNWHDLMWAANSDFWDEALEEALENLPQLEEEYGNNPLKTVRPQVYILTGMTGVGRKTLLRELIKKGVLRPYEGLIEEGVSYGIVASFREVEDLKSTLSAGTYAVIYVGAPEVEILERLLKEERAKPHPKCVEMIKVFLADMDEYIGYEADYYIDNGGDVSNAANAVKEIVMFGGDPE